MLYAVPRETCSTHHGRLVLRALLEDPQTVCFKLMQCPCNRGWLMILSEASMHDAALNQAVEAVCTETVGRALIIAL